MFPSSLANGITFATIIHALVNPVTAHLAKRGEGIHLVNCSPAGSAAGLISGVIYCANDSNCRPSSDDFCSLSDGSGGFFHFEGAPFHCTFKNGVTFSWDLPSDAQSKANFAAVDVSHDSSVSTPVPTWPPSSATGPRTGLGPFNIVFQIDHPGTGSSSSSDCTPAAPPSVLGDNNVNLALYSEDRCCSQVQTFKLGTLDSCHNTSDPFKGFYQAPGTNFFGKNIHVVTFESPDCLGRYKTTKLTNVQPACWPGASDGNAARSLKISVTDGDDSSGCILDKPTPKSDNTVALRFYDGGAGGCCTPVQTTNLGNVGDCHDAEQPFRALKQGVGVNMFDKDIHVFTYKGKQCSGASVDYSLTNSGQCFHDPGDTDEFLSYKLMVVGSPAQNCALTQPKVGSDDTVTIDFFSSNTDKTPFYESKIGNFNVCHNTKQSFKAVKQAVGKNLFGRNIHIRMYEDDRCGAPSYAFADLTNNGKCVVGTQNYNSFMVSEDRGDGTQGVCPTPQPTNSDDNAAVLDLYAGSQCCNARIENIKIGELDKCHKAVSEFGSLRMRVGKNLFGQSNHVELFQSEDCSDATWNFLELTNENRCDDGNTWKSFRIRSSPKPSTPSSCINQPAISGPDDYGFIFSTDDKCCTNVASYANTGIIAEGGMSCFTLNTPIKSFTMGVGSDLFGKKIHLRMYDDPFCSGASGSADLTNNAVCVNGAPDGGWQSFAMQRDGGGSQAPPPPPTKSCPRVCSALGAFSNCWCQCDDGTKLSLQDGGC